MKKKLEKQKQFKVRFLTPGGDWIDVPGCGHYRVHDSGEIILKNHQDGLTLAIAPKGSALITNWNSL